MGQPRAQAKGGLRGRDSSAEARGCLPAGSGPLRHRGLQGRLTKQAKKPQIKTKNKP